MSKKFLLVFMLVLGFGLEAHAQKLTTQERYILRIEFAQKNVRMSLSDLAEFAGKISGIIEVLQDSTKTFSAEQAALLSQVLASSFAAADTLLAAWEDVERTGVAPLRKRAIEGYLPLAACRLLSSAARKLRERPLTIVEAKQKQ